LIFLPRSYIEEVLLVATNSAIEGQPVSFGEFLRWLGIWYLLAMNHCASRREYWSSMPIDMFQGAPFQLHDIMSGSRFEAILSAIRLTNATPSDYQDCFIQFLITWKQFIYQCHELGIPQIMTK